MYCISIVLEIFFQTGNFNNEFIHSITQPVKNTASEMCFSIFVPFFCHFQPKISANRGMFGLKGLAGHRVILKKERRNRRWRRYGLLLAYHSALLPTVRGNDQVTLIWLTFSYVCVSLPPVAQRKVRKREKKLNFHIIFLIWSNRDVNEYKYIIQIWTDNMLWTDMNGIGIFAVICSCSNMWS